MKRYFKRRWTMIVFFLLINHVFVLAQWNGDPTVNTSICTANGTQGFQKIIEDSAGGAIICWIDLRNGISYDLYAQRINSAGESLWTTDGVPVCLASGTQLSIEMIPDGSGGALIVWNDVRNGSNQDVYAQKINSNGNAEWGSNGIPICTAANDQGFPSIITDGSGGAIICWDDYRNGSGNYDIYAQKVNSSGAVQWASNGVAVCNNPEDQIVPTMVTDGNGGAIITWYDYRNAASLGTVYDIYAQRINSSGNQQWANNGLSVCTFAHSQSLPKITSDNNGGAIIVWEDRRNGGSAGNRDLYAQRVNSSGNMLWTTNGKPVCTAPGIQSEYQLIPDDSGGVIISWEDFRSSTYDIYAQRLNSGGNPYWTTDGIVICNASQGQYDLQLVKSGDGAIITWRDTRNSSFDIYAQKINASGTAMWTANGEEVCTATGSQRKPQLATDGMEGAIICWYDSRDGDNDIYASRMLAIGALPVELTSFRAERSYKNVLLTWTTANEKNNAGFVVEQSFDGSQFSEIDFVSGQGDSQVSQEYTSIHENITDQALSHFSYYRIKQVDYDGKATYSSVEVVDLDVNTSSFKIASIKNDYPANNWINIYFSHPYQSRKIKVLLSDINGTVISRVRTPISEDLNVLELELPQGLKGMYFLTINTGEEIVGKKLLLDIE